MIEKKMDFPTRLTTNIENLVVMFNNRMAEYEGKLQGASHSKTPDADIKASDTNIITLSNEFSQFKEFVWQTLSTIKTQVEMLTFGFDSHEMYMRRKVLLIHGVPETKNESAYTIVLKVLTEQMKLPEIKRDHLHICHRLGIAHSKPRPILIRFFNLQDRIYVWSNKTALKGTGMILTEFLTKPRHTVFLDARKYFGVRNCWTSNGKIMLFLPNKQRSKLETMSELKLIMSQFPQLQLLKSFPITPAKDLTKINMLSMEKLTINSPNTQ